jgi:Cu/Ag efflux protein CusF
MKRQNSNLIQNYTDGDLQSFTILGNFKNYRSDSIETKNKQNIDQSVGYALSDNKHFQKLMNFNKNTKTSSNEYSINDFTDSDDLTDKKTHKVEDSFYNESDIQNFKNLKQFPLSSSPDTLQYTSKKEDPVVTKINYTVSDLEAFDRIVESKEDSTNNQTAAKNTDAKNLKLTIDRSSIKIIDFDELKKQETIQNKQRIGKIKVVYSGVL